MLNKRMAGITVDYKITATALKNSTEE